MTASDLCGADSNIFGLGTICSSYPFTLRLAQAIKQRRPDAVVILGGPQASVVDVPTLEAFPAVDFVVRGEADQSLPLLVDALMRGVAPGAIAGITHRQGSRIVRNPAAPPLANLDGLPLPAFDLYHDVSEWPYLPLELGRGCPFSCTFCSTNDFFRRKFRLKSPETLLRQMRMLRDAYKITRFDLIHDMFTVDRRKVAEFCDVMRGQEMTWSCSARTDCVDQELLDRMAEAGCTGIFFGIETGSPRMQRIIDKGLDLEESRRILEAADSRGISSTYSLIMGYPEETIDDFRQTVQFFGDGARLDLADPQLHRLAPLAATPLAIRYRDQLVLDGYYSDISTSFDTSDDDLKLIAAHPDLFPNFYALPCALDREYLRATSEFLMGLFQRAKTLLVALHQESGNLLEVCEAWHCWRADSETARSWSLEDALRFVRTAYGGRGWTATEIACRFYQTLADSDRSRSAPSSSLVEHNGEATPDAVPALAPEISMVRVEGDFPETVRSLRRRENVPLELMGRKLTLLVRPAAGQRSGIAVLSPVQSCLLDACDGVSTVAEIVSRLEERQELFFGMSASLFCPAALDALRQQGVIRFYRAAQAIAANSW